jgi:hypothetical protein
MSRSNSAVEGGLGTALVDASNISLALFQIVRRPIPKATHAMNKAAAFGHGVKALLEVGSVGTNWTACNEAAGGNPEKAECTEGHYHIPELEKKKRGANWHPSRG